MRLLLDTHIALWAIADSPRLSVRARALIGDEGNQIAVSAGSIWEIAIKRALARGSDNDMPISGDEAIGYFREAGFELLDISPRQAAPGERLPALHADPFDRMLVAQALDIPLRLITRDARVSAYSDQIILV